MSPKNSGISANVPNTLGTEKKFGLRNDVANKVSGTIFAMS